MKYFLPLLFIFSILFSCNKDSEIIALERERELKVTDSILNIIHNNWDFNFPENSSTVKKEIEDWQKWNVLVQELNTKPSKNISAYRTKIENLTQISDELLTTVPVKISVPNVNARLKNLNTNIKHLNSFISLNTIPIQKIISINNYIKNDVTGINAQIEEYVKIKAIPTENGEQEMIKKIADTSRRANFNFEDEIKLSDSTKTSKKIINRNRLLLNEDGK